MNRRAAAVVTAILTAGLVACGSNEPQSEAQHEPPARRAQPADVPQGVLAPVDAWRRELAARLPASWRLEGIESQVEAPPGYTREAGGRGLVLRFAGEAAAQALWVMPVDFVGKGTDPAVQARPVAASADFVLYAPAQDAPDWTHTPQVVAALGMTPRE